MGVQANEGGDLLPYSLSHPLLPYSMGVQANEGEEEEEEAGGRVVLSPASTAAATALGASSAFSLSPLSNPSGVRVAGGGGGRLLSSSFSPGSERSDSASVASLTHSTAADMFSLGITLFELLANVQLPE